MTATRRHAWTAAEVVALGVRTDVPTAGEILAGLCRTESYELFRRGQFPVPVISVGRRLVVPVQPVLALLGLEVARNGEGGPAPPGPPADNQSTAAPSATRNDSHDDNRH